MVWVCCIKFHHNFFFVVAVLNIKRREAKLSAKDLALMLDCLFVCFLDFFCCCFPSGDEDRFGSKVTKKRQMENIS